MGADWEPKLTVKLPVKAPKQVAVEELIQPRSSGDDLVKKALAKTGYVVGTRLVTDTGNIRDRFKFGKELGRGHFGIVKVCEDLETGKKYACKSILKANLKKREELDELRAEIELMRHLKGHPHIVEMHALFEDKEAVHLVMELCKEGDLFDYIARRRRLVEGDAARIFRQIVLAVQHCHARGVIHRDLKPENIIFEEIGDEFQDPLVKVADFGLAVMPEPGQKASGLAGSPFYMAPELVRREKYGTEVDIWSMGVVLYTALSGFLPFWGKDHEQTFAAVLKAEPDYLKKPWPSVSREARRLVRWMLHVDPKRRATIDDILSNPWLMQHCSPTKAKEQPSKFSFLSGKGGAAAVAQLPTPPASPNPLSARAVGAIQPIPPFKPSHQRVPTPPCTSPSASGVGYVIAGPGPATDIPVHNQATYDPVPPPTIAPPSPSSNSFLQKLSNLHPFGQAAPKAQYGGTPPASPRSPKTPTFAFGKKNLYALFNSQPQEAPNRHELVMQRPIDKLKGVMPAEEFIPHNSPNSSPPHKPGASALVGKSFHRMESPRSPLEESIFPMSPKLRNYGYEGKGGC
eukprot:jgi/Mesen1/10116/ME000075S09622